MIVRSKLILVSLLLPLPLSVSMAAVDDGQLGCVLEPSMEVEVASQVTGVAKLVHASRGDQVKKGDNLVTLETDVEQAVVELAAAKAEFADRKVERNRSLISRGLLSEHERDEIITEQRIAGLEVREAEVRLRQRSIKSPIDGVVVERMINPGEYVSSEPVLKLMQLNPLHAEIVMQSDYYGKVKQGMKAKIELEEPVKGRFDGRVTIVDQVLDAASSTFGVRVEMPNPSFRVPSGLKCRVLFN